jgi:OmpA-OmpF porin, OOP family
MSIFNNIVLGLGLLAAAVSPVVAQTVPKEVPGGKDSPVISRYAGSVLQNTASETFASIRVPAGPGHYASDKLVFDQSATVEGRVNSYFYVGPKGRSALEVFRNDEAALSQAGFTTLYRCEMSTCDQALIRDAYRREVADVRQWLPNRSDPSSSIERDIRFISAKGQRNGADVNVLLFVAEPNSIWQAPASVLIVVEPAAMEGGKVTVGADQLQRGLADAGRIALYGLYFDTGKAQIKPESKAQLDEMGKLLTQDRALKVAIVGHTDNEGSAEANQVLSQKRAEAVVAALVSGYRIDAARLKARGVASFAPVATNRSEAGRAKNRRVELVEQ